jgi:hypothetical protein
MHDQPAGPDDPRSTSWHRRLYEASYIIFDGTAPREADAWHYRITVGLALGYLLAGAVAFLFLNAATLPFGVYVDPPWLHRARFRLLRLPNGLPVLVVSCIVLGAYALWRNWLAHGLAETIGGVVLTFVLGIGSFAAVIGFNTLRARRRPG